MIVNPQISQLHETYCKLSHMDVTLRFNRESSWMEFLRYGFTKADLEAVLKRLLRLIEAGERRPEALKFSNVVEALDRFEEEVAMIKAEANGLKVGDRLSVMDLQRVIDAKMNECAQLKFSCAREDTFGLVWTNPDAQAKYVELRKEIKDLFHRISKMA